MQYRNPKPAPDNTRQKIGRLRNHPFIIPVTTFMVLFFVVLFGFISLSGTTEGATDTRVVTITVDGDKQVVPTRANSVANLLERLDLKLGDKDIVRPALDTPIEDDGFEVELYRARPVLVIDGNKQEVTYTAEPDPANVAKTLGIKLYPEDALAEQPVNTTEDTDFITDGIVAEQVVIERATPVVLNLYGTPVKLRTHAETVEGLLAEKGVQLNEGDNVQPAITELIEKNEQVFVLREGKIIKQVKEKVAPPVTYVNDFNLGLGVNQVKEEGRAGIKLVTYEIEQANGKTKSKRVIQSVVIRQPIKQVVARGRKAAVIAGNRSEILTSAGIPANQHNAADFIISHESGWRVNALNARGCAGLGQACPGSKLANVCPNWQSDAVCQMKFFNSYAVGRYGSWNRAMEIWQTQRWW